MPKEPQQKLARCQMVLDSLKQIFVPDLPEEKFHYTRVLVDGLQLKVFSRRKLAPSIETQSHAFQFGIPFRASCAQLSGVKLAPMVATDGALNVWHAIQTYFRQFYIHAKSHAITSLF